MYAIYDSQYYLPILETNKILELENQVLLINLVLYLVEQDLIGYVDVE